MDEYATLLALATERGSSSSLAARMRAHVRDPDGRFPRVFDAGFHAGWNALREVIRGSVGANNVRAQLTELRALVRRQREEVAALQARALRHKEERRTLVQERDRYLAALRRILGVDGPCCEVGEKIAREVLP